MRSRLNIKNLVAINRYDKEGVVLAFTMLRFIATCLITNTHYNNVYPINGLAVGGLLGDVLFFIVSGFVLSKPEKQNFISWYWKRIVRIYPTVIFGGIFYLLTGYVTMDGQTWFSAFVFPTFFVFAATIILLYIPLYFVNRIKEKNKYLLIFAIVLTMYLLVYIFAFDKSTYQMNNTWNLLLISFPYFLGMLFGGYLRKFGLKKRNHAWRFAFWVLATIFCVLYFFANYIVRGNKELYSIQIIVPITLLIGLGMLVCAVYSMEESFWKWPSWLLFSVNFVANLTLEIYVIQKPIIGVLENIFFPLNWILITVSILVCALLLRILINLFTECIRMVIEKF